MGNMMKKKFGKSVLLACVLVVTLLSTSVSALAYTITGGTDGFDITELSQSTTDIKTLTVPVEGAGTNQITVVVRKDNNNWLTAPNDNVLFIDQVTGAGTTTNLVMSFDTKWTDHKENYKIFVGGSGQTVTEAALRVGSDGPMPKPANPTGAVANAVYGAPVEISFSPSAEYTDTIQVETKASAGGTYSVEGTYAGTDGKYTIEEDGYYRVSVKRVTKDETDSTYSAGSIEFRIDAESVKTLATSIETILLNGATVAATEIAAIKKDIPDAYNALSSYQKTAFEALTSNTFAELQEDLNEVRTLRFGADLTASTVYGLIDALPTVAEIGDMDETEIKAVVEAVNAIDTAITTLAAPYTTAGDTAAVAEIKTIANAYDSGKLAAIRAAVMPSDEVVLDPNPTLAPVATKNLGKANGILVTFTLPAGNGTLNVTVGGVAVPYSSERNKYVGVVDVANWDAVNSKILNIATTPVDATNPLLSYKYGDLTGDGAINNTDLLRMKIWQTGVTENFDGVTRPSAGDMNADGAINNSDLLMVKLQQADIPNYVAPARGL